MGHDFEIKLARNICCESVSDVAWWQEKANSFLGMAIHFQVNIRSNVSLAKGVSTIVAANTVT